MSEAGPSPDVVVGADGVPRCRWGVATDDYRLYHDTEWGVPVHGETPLYERLTLEAFQSGLSWLTILRKREAFREAFQGFEAERVARFGDDQRAELMANPAIVRNRLKIDAAITNARAVVALREQGGLDALFWSHAPEHHDPPARLSDLPATSPESMALAKALKRAGFVFVGPTTLYAAMQACGVVDDHVAGCHRARPQVSRVGT
jgi:DNA-3-methyladenine glycosylase I